MSFQKGDKVKVIGVSKGIRMSSAVSRKWMPLDVGIIVKVCNGWIRCEYDVLFPDGKKQRVPQKDLKRA